MSELKQKTIENPVSITGAGIHTGTPSKITLLPAEIDAGIRFHVGKEVIEASVTNVHSTTRCTALGKNGITVHTVEHILASCFGLGIDNLTVEVEGVEIPALDGSGLEFTRKLKEAGIIEQDGEKKILALEDKITLREGDSCLVAVPAHRFSITTIVDYNHPVVGTQMLAFSPEEESFEELIAPARTFAFREEVEHLLAKGLGKGGSLDNAVIIDKDAYMNEPRFKDEIVRHKCLDLIGDLTLVGSYLQAHIFALKPGHKMNVGFVRRILESIS